MAAALFIGLLGAAGARYFGPAVYRITTNQGQLVIETNDVDVEVNIKQKGEQVQIIDTKTKREFTLKAGTYELELVPGHDGLRLNHQSIPAGAGRAGDCQGVPGTTRQEAAPARVDGDRQVYRPDQDGSDLQRRAAVGRGQGATRLDRRWQGPFIAFSPDGESWLSRSLVPMGPR